MNGEQISVQLTRHGLNEVEGARKRLLGDLVLEHFRALAGGDPSGALWVPGRIEVFGKHTDYGGGHSLVAPVPRGQTPREANASVWTSIIARPRPPRAKPRPQDGAGMRPPPFTGWIATFPAR
jgi:hypothetical protein